jgi:hypothetical protein
MAPTDQAVIMLHCPRWLLDWFWGTRKSKNLRQLIRGPLRGRARLSIAGDLHFYMRHSWRQYGPDQTPSMAPSELNTPLGASPVGGSPTSSRAPTPTPSAYPYLSPSQLHQSLLTHLAGDGGSNAGLAPMAGTATWQEQQQQQAREGFQGFFTHNANGNGSGSSDGSVPGESSMQQQQQQGYSHPNSLVPAGASPAGGSPTAAGISLAAMEQQQQPFLRSGSSDFWGPPNGMGGNAGGQGIYGSSPGAGSELLESVPEDSSNGYVTPPNEPAGEFHSPLDSRAQRSSPSSKRRTIGAPDASRPIGIAAGRRTTTLPMLSPVHSSQLGADVAQELGQLVLPARTATANGGSGRRDEAGAGGGMEGRSPESSWRSSLTGSSPPHPSGLPLPPSNASSPPQDSLATAPGRTGNGRLSGSSPSASTASWWPAVLGRRSSSRAVGEAAAQGGMKRVPTATSTGECRAWFCFCAYMWWWSGKECLGWGGNSS